MKDKLLLLIIIFICGSINVVAADISIILNGTKKKVRCIDLDGNIFVNYEHFFKLFNEKLKHTNNNIYHLSHTNTNIIAYPQSFYIIFFNDVDSNIIQLNTPTYNQNDNLYIPISSLLSGMKVFFDIKYDIVRNDIYINFDNKLRDFFVAKEDTIKHIAHNTKKETPKNTPIIKEEIPKNTPIVKEEITKNTPIVKEEIPKNNPIKKEETPKNNPIKKEETPKNNPIIKEEIPKNTPTIKREIEYKKNIEQELYAAKVTINPQDIIANYSSLENINKPTLASLSYSKQSFLIDKQERQLFDRSNIEDIEIKKNSDLPALLPSNEVPADNKALPPFRKYTIPHHIKKEGMENLR